MSDGMAILSAINFDLRNSADHGVVELAFQFLVLPLASSN
jgi:hypothetical protein